MRTVEGFLQDILKQPVSEDYVFVKLLDETPILSPMEQIRTVYPNAMHVERKAFQLISLSEEQEVGRTKKDEFTLFHSFYYEVSGKEASEETEQIFKEVLTLLAQEEREGGKAN